MNLKKIINEIQATRFIDKRTALWTGIGSVFLYVANE